ncbi:MAG: hypothetical protein LBS25_07835, partial [Candidatus Symbiothrix sp.]|nr:hypothetical protein [Candidatus Symbiothrix sp.]
MKRTKILSLLLIVLATVGVTRAQVHIGEMTDAHIGAVLDLTNSQNSGLLLPRVELVDFEILTVGGVIEAGPDETAKGMTVYNTNLYALNGLGVYVWDGAKWISIYASGKIKATLATCRPDYYEVDATKYVDITVNGYTGSDGIFVGANTGTAMPYTAGTKTLRFLTYNLGANPNIAGPNATAAQIAKAQMAYVSAGTASEDMTVFGGLYQWGRKDKEHSLRCATSGHEDNFSLNLPYSSANYNPATDTLFVQYRGGSTGADCFYDWVSDHVADDNR